VDIETENDGPKADLPDFEERTLTYVSKTIGDHPWRAEVEKDVNEDNYLRVERTMSVHAELLSTEHGQLREHSG